jgi:predicted phage terminase large subunit-like protein
MKTNLTFNTTPVFEANRTSGKRIIVNQGGTSSSKTYSIIQLLALLAIQGSCVITVAGQDIPNLKKGALRDALNEYSTNLFIKRHILNYNKSDRVFEFKNRSIIEFNSYGDEQDAKSGKRDYLFINEANGIAWEVYWQLDIRTRKKIFIDYNPTTRFWVHEKLIGRNDVDLIISDHRHNPFLTQDEHDKIESIADPEYWKVYARGKTGKIEGLLFPESDLKFADLSRFDANDAVWSFAVGDPADKGGDYYAMPFCHVVMNNNNLNVVVRDIIFSKDGVEANTERIAEKVRQYGIEKCIIESNGGWVSNAVLLKKTIETQTQVSAYTNSVNKLVRILSNYEFIIRHFVFDANYKTNPDYKAYICNLCSFLKEGKNANDDAPDVTAAAANIVKVKYRTFLYG